MFDLELTRLQSPYSIEETMKFNSRAGAVVSLMLVQMSVAERAVLSIRGEGDGSGRALKGIKKCKFQLSGKAC